jgi:glycosyltransferase involved in cell wall biosynthesis
MFEPAIYILCPLLDTPSGGGNQFLKALRNELRRKECYAERPEDAEAILFNLSPFEIRDLLPSLYKIKKKRPDLPIVARIDGPIWAYRGTDDAKCIDKACHSFAKELADGVIFQSSWSAEAHKAMGYASGAKHITIVNAPDSMLFFQKIPKWNPGDRIKIIATSWSPNMNKGFDYYLWLDEHLDFSKYSVTFVGNSPVNFRNILHLPPQAPEELSVTLREHDIYITASLNDPCSNALIEAVHTGLPVVARRSGGHPELVHRAGELFDNPEEIPGLLDRIVNAPERYARPSHLKGIDEIALDYLAFVNDLLIAQKNKTLVPRVFSPITVAKIFFQVRGPYTPHRIARFLLRSVRTLFTKHNQ